MQTIKLRMTSDAPLIIQADTLADPLHPLTREYKEVTSKKKKTDADHIEMARIEFIGGMYIDNEIGPYLPSDNVFKTLVEGARLTKNGKSIERGAFILHDKFPLEYDGPRDLNGLLADRKYHYRKTVVIARARTVRVRPIFRDWKCIVEIVFDETVVNAATVKQSFEASGRYIGIGNRRPNRGGNFGRFSVEAVR